MVMTMLEGTIMIIVLGLILAHAKEFGMAIASAGDVFSKSVKTLSSVAG